jgi:hypothetical protein
VHLPDHLDPAILLPIAERNRRDALNAAVEELLWECRISLHIGWAEWLYLEVWRFLEMETPCVCVQSQYWCPYVLVVV